MSKLRVIILAPENVILGRQLAENYLKDYGSDIFTVESASDKPKNLKKYDVIISLSEKLTADPAFIPASVRHYDWVVSKPFDVQKNNDSFFGEEIKLFVREFIQTFRSPTARNESLNHGIWSRYYQKEETTWDLGEPSPPFVSLYQEGAFKKGSRIAIPGCGKGHEVLFFAGKGFEVTAIDFADEALQIVNKRLDDSGLKAELVRADFLNLSSTFNEAFDYLLEQTCYCAIEPVNRSDYVRTAHRLLRPNGEFLGLFYDIDNIDGPPFGASGEEVRQRFSPYFRIEYLEKSLHSHERRMGKEWLARFKKSSL